MTGCYVSGCVQSLAGTTLGGTWQLEARIGRGGMGEVWLARHTRVAEKQAAIKIMRGLGALDPALLQRFQREAAIAAKLEHPNIVQLFDFDTLPSGEPYLVMEYLRGESLKTRMAAGPLDWAQLRPLAIELCSALHLAHRRGIVHRDLKPENVFLARTPTGVQVKLLDFGISKVVGSDSMNTSNEVLIGTPSYMSPEQAMGNNSELDARTDVFSLAVVLYEALSGRSAFAADHIPQTVHNVVFRELPPLEEAPAEVREALRHALVKEREARTPDIAAFARALTGVSLGDAEAAPRPPAAHPGPPTVPDEAPEDAPRKVLSATRVDAPRDAAPLTGAPGAVTPAVREAEPPRRGRWPFLLVAVALVGAAAALLWPRGATPPTTPAVAPEAPRPPPADDTLTMEAPTPLEPSAAPVAPTEPTIDVPPPGEPGPTKSGKPPAAAPALTEAQRAALADLQRDFDAKAYRAVLQGGLGPTLATVPQATRLRVMAACELGDVVQATSLRPRLSPRDVPEVRRLCRKRGIDF